MPPIFPNKIDSNAASPQRHRRNWQRASKGALQNAIKVIFPFLNTTKGLSLAINPSGGLGTPTNGLSITLTTPSGLILSTNGLSFNPTTTGGLQISTNGASIKNDPAGGLTSGTNGEAILLATPSGLILSTNGLAFSPTAAGGLQIMTNGASILLSGTNSGLSLTTNGLSAALDGTTVFVSGSNVSSLRGSLSATGKTNSLGTTTIFASTANGLYEVNIYLNITTVGTGTNTLSGTLGWTDDQQAQTAAVPSISTTNKAFTQLTETIWASNNTNITLATTLTGTGTYNYRAAVRRLL